MKKDNFTIHIGLHKTGTTYLQTALFPSIPGVKVIRNFETYRQAIAAGPHEMYIYSDETLSGDLWGDYLESFEQNIASIKAMYGDARIIMGIRAQRDLILSVYKQYLHESHSADVDSVFNEANTGLLKHESLFIASKIDRLKSTFSRVFIYDQPSLLRREEAFTAALLDFLGISPQTVEVDTSQVIRNVGIRTEAQVHWLKRLNKLSATLTKIHPKLSLYNRWMFRHNLTPRAICQNRMSGDNSPRFTLAPDLIRFIHAKYQADYQEALSHVRF